MLPILDADGGEALRNSPTVDGLAFSQPFCVGFSI